MWCVLCGESVGHHEHVHYTIDEAEGGCIKFHWHDGCIDLDEEAQTMFTSDARPEDGITEQQKATRFTEAYYALVLAILNRPGRAADGIEVRRDTRVKGLTYRAKGRPGILTRE